MPLAQLDLYASIHKARRYFIGETLAAVGRLDADDDVECQSTLNQVRDLLDLLERPLQHEDEFIHAAMQARWPDSVAQRDREHIRHVHAIGALRRRVDRLEQADRGARTVLVRTLYRALALFVAENPGHMHEEEAANNVVLWAEYTDAELAQIQDRLVASIDAGEMAPVLRWIAPSVSSFERATRFGALHARAPTQALYGALELARRHLSLRDWNKLMFDIAAAPLAA